MKRRWPVQMLKQRNNRGQEAGCGGHRLLGRPDAAQGSHQERQVRTGGLDEVALDDVASPAERRSPRPAAVEHVLKTSLEKFAALPEQCPSVLGLRAAPSRPDRSEEHTSELRTRTVGRLLRYHGLDAHFL